MVTRRSRLDEFVTGHHPTADLPVQLLCEDHVGTYVIPFPCQYTAGEWVNTATGEGISGGCSRMAGVSAKPKAGHTQCRGSTVTQAGRRSLTRALGDLTEILSRAR
jgi:hypothetical protein